MRGEMSGPPSASIMQRTNWSAGRRFSSGSSYRRRINSPPSSQRLSRWRLKVRLARPRRRRSSRNGLSVATIAAPGARSTVSYCQRWGHSSRSGQAGRSRASSSGEDNAGRVDLPGLPDHAAHAPAQRLPSLSRLCLCSGTPDRGPQNDRDRGAPTHGLEGHSAAGCGRPGPSYDLLPRTPLRVHPAVGLRRDLRYRMRRVQCRRCGVKVEQVPWADGKHTLTKAYMLYLAHWARKLSWQETARSFRTSWDQVGPGGRVRGAVGAGAPATGCDQGHRRRRNCLRPGAQVFDAGLPDRIRLRPLAVGRQERTTRELRGILRPDRRGTGRQDRVRVLGHVAALPGRDRREMSPRRSASWTVSTWWRR